MPIPLQTNTVHQLDCIEAMAALPAGCVDLAFADPPFNIGYDYDVYDDGRTPETYLGWCKQWITGLHRVLKPDGTFWLAIGDEYAAELKVIAQREAGFRCRSWVIWYYTFGVNCKMKFSRSHVHLFHFVKDEEQFTFNGHAIRVPSARQLVYGDLRANPHGRLPDDTWILRPQDLSDGFEPDEDAWYFPRVAGTFKERAGFHGCQMPEQLLGRIIRVSSNPGEMVLDPFAGSATTLVVAKKLGRNFLGFDISPEYIERGRDRLAMVNPGDELDGAAEPRVSAPATSAGRKRNTAFVVASAPAAPQPETEKASRVAVDPDLAALLIESVQNVAQGFSIDRLIADPALNSEFIATCRKQGATLPSAQLNACLFRLRKAGKLSHLHATRRTEFTWRELDQFLHASEIAWMSMIESGSCRSLDEILCDPDKALQFDQLAAQFAPGFESLQYRWAALALRKVAKDARVRSVDLSTVKARIEVKLDNLNAWDGVSSLYLILGDRNQPLYVGETLDLGSRIRAQVGDEQVQPVWAKYAGQVHVECFHVATLDRVLRDSVRSRRLIALQSRLIEKYDPTLNLPLLSAT